MWLLAAATVVAILNSVGAAIFERVHPMPSGADDVGRWFLLMNRVVLPGEVIRLALTIGALVIVMQLPRATAVAAGAVVALLGTWLVPFGLSLLTPTLLAHLSPTAAIWIPSTGSTLVGLIYLVLLVLTLDRIGRSVDARLPATLTSLLYVLVAMMPLLFIAQASTRYATLDGGWSHDSTAELIGAVAEIRSHAWSLLLLVSLAWLLRRLGARGAKAVRAA